MSFNVNELTSAELERLAILLEELGEAQQCIGKILRHGYESINPLKPASPKNPPNRISLERELGDVLFAITQMTEAADITFSRIEAHSDAKREAIKPYLHHQSSRHPSTKEER